MTPLEVLENWRYGNKGRWVEIHIDNGYGAACWNVLLGNTNVPRQEGWAKDTREMPGSIVSGAECSFFDHDSIPPNVIFIRTEEETFPGLGPLILATVARAQELGL